MFLVSVLVRLFIFSPLSSLFFPVFGVFRDPVTVAVVGKDGTVVPTVVRDATAIKLITTSDVTKLTCTGPTARGGGVTVDIKAVVDGTGVGFVFAPFHSSSLCVLSVCFDTVFSTRASVVRRSAWQCYDSCVGGEILLWGCY